MTADPGEPLGVLRALRRCALAALLVVASVFPDVIFLGASLSLANFVNVTVEPLPSKVRLIRERSGREFWHGYYDAGGAAFQSEPAIQFMARALRSGQSIFWNPYSAGGAFGPETLVDIKTSPISMTVALLGGGDRAFHAAMLGAAFLGVFCLLVLLHVELKLSLLAAIAGGVTYLLNGYHIANLGSNVSQTWYYFPVLALALVSYARQPRILALLGITAGSILVLSTTFLPTTLIVMACTLFIGAAAALGRATFARTGAREVSGAAARIVAGQAGGVLLAALILAVLYLPIYEVLRYMATDDYYAKRNFYPANFVNFISMFTPKHAFEEYNAISQRAAELRGNVAFHQGIIGALLITQAVRAWPVFQRALLWAIGAGLVLLAARAYGLPGLTQVANALPVIGTLGEQYLWVGIGIFFTLLVPFGVHALTRDGVRKATLNAGAIIVVGALAYVYWTIGVDNWPAVFYAFVMGFIIAGGFIVIGKLRDPASRAGRKIAILLVVMSWAELTLYMNNDRLSRTERFAEPPRFVRFLQAQGGQHRIASYGSWGLPPEYGAAYGIYQVDSMNFQLNPRYEAIFNRLILPDPADRWTGFITLNRAKDKGGINLEAFDFLGTRHLVVPVRYPLLLAFMARSGWKQVYEDQHFRIFENPQPLPRAFIASRLVPGKLTPIESGLPARSVATTDDPKFIELARQLGVREDGPDDAQAQAAITRYDHDRVEITASLARPGILVLNDTWHPNWRVTVDGRAEPLGLVNGAFRGVALPAGRHAVEMAYAPRSLPAGKILSVLGLLLALALVVMRRRLDPILAGSGRTPAGGPTAAASAQTGPLPSFCIALPVYNEAAGIESCIDGVASFLDSVQARTAIIAVDDGSSDGSFDLMQRMKERWPRLIVHRHEKNQGYGAANRTLCRLAGEHGFDYAIVMDADGTQHPRYIANFFPPMRAGVDFVKATRYRLGGGVSGVPWQRYLISRFGNLLARAVMGIPLSDFSNGFRAICTDKWREIKSTELRFELLIEECYLARKLDLSFGEVPYVLTVRQDSGSTSKFSYRWDVYFNYLRYVFKR